MFHVTIGEEGLENSWQEVFPATTECCQCGGEARVGFVANEYRDREPGWEKDLVADLHLNEVEGEGAWLHDCCAVAVYFCKECLASTSLWNQA
jgi:hypothetical protein